ncbi:MAG TPA: hypothetical protein DD640_00405 [Clostridiales bacterium]|nr:hypothetical protein [Clostridiales bacterium]
MSYQDGMAAINLEMPARVPRTEYVDQHWDLYRTVTGIPVDSASSPQVQSQAYREFMRLWNFDFSWCTLTTGQIFGEQRSRMGHARYLADGSDLDRDIRELFADPEDVYQFDLFEAFGTADRAALTAGYNAQYHENCRNHPDCVNMTGIYVTCISGLIDLLGWDTLLAAAGIDGQAFGAFTDRYCAWIGQYFDALACCDSPVIMIHDDIVWAGGAFLNPEFYRAHVFANYRKMFRPLQDAGKKIIFTSDGNYTQFIDDIAACGINGFVLEPLTDMQYIASRYGRTHSFVGNADTRILLQGSRSDIEAEVRRCMDIGKNCPGFFLAVGNHIPANTPVDNILYYNEIYEKLSRR